MRAGALQAASGMLFRTETPYAMADGSERVIDLMLAPVMDEQGKVLFIAQTGTDITERKQVEQRLRLLIESAKDYAILALNTERQVVSWSSGARSDEFLLPGLVVAASTGALTPLPSTAGNT